jgi:hypothetical protein
MAAIIKMIATTISNSISENPFWRFIIQVSFGFNCTSSQVQASRQRITPDYSMGWRVKGGKNDDKWPVRLTKKGG